MVQVDLPNHYSREPQNSNFVFPDGPSDLRGDGGCLVVYERKDAGFQCLFRRDV